MVTPLQISTLSIHIAVGAVFCFVFFLIERKLNLKGAPSSPVVYTSLMVLSEGLKLTELDDDM